MAVSRRNASSEALSSSSSSSRVAPEARARVRRDESPQRAPPKVAAAATATTTTGVAVGDVCATDAKVDESEASALRNGGGEPPDAERNPRQEIAIQWFASTLRSALAIQYRSVPPAGPLPGADWSTSASAGVYASIGRVELTEPATDGGLAERDGSRTPSPSVGGREAVDGNDDDRDEDGGDRESVRQWRRSSYNGIRSDPRNHLLYESVRKTASDDEDPAIDRGVDPADQDRDDHADFPRSTPPAGSRRTGRDLHAQRAVVFDRPRGRDRSTRAAASPTVALVATRR